MKLIGYMLSISVKIDPLKFGFLLKESDFIKNTYFEMKSIIKIILH